MLFLAADDIVAPGGPSAPVWAFLTAISLGIIALIQQQLSAKKAANEAKVLASKAAENADKAQANTTSISNGFAGRMDSKLDSIIAEQNSQGNALRKHLEWHLSEGNQK